MGGNDYGFGKIQNMIFVVYIVTFTPKRHTLMYHTFQPINDVLNWSKVHICNYAIF